MRSTRDVILDAAERHFAERGFDGVAVREIATDAGLKNQASLYHHFRNKRHLYEAVLGRGIDPIVTVVAASSQSDTGAGEAGTVPDVVAGFLDSVVDYLVEHPHLPRLLQRAALDDSRYLRTTLGRSLKPLYAQGLGVLAKRAPAWDAADRMHLGAGLYLLIFGYFANAQLIDIVSGDDPLSPAAIERQRGFLRSAVRQLLAGGAAPETATARRRRKN